MDTESRPQEHDMMTLTDVQGVIAHWWFAYDQGDFATLTDLLTDDVHFSCESDTGTTPFEAFIRCDTRGRPEVMAWQTDHRLNSPYPLRHNATNIHLTRTESEEADFASYIFVSQIVEGAVSPLSTGLVRGTVRRQDDAVRIADLRVTLDTMSSIPLTEHQTASAAG
jgi:hypothetical protein